MNKSNFILKLSLEEMALRRVVVNLWTESDVIAEIAASLHNQIDFDNQLIGASKVKDKLSRLKLPTSLEKRMLDIVEPIGLQFSTWRRFHECFLWSFNVPDYYRVYKKLCWTTAGSIDFKRTAEKLVNFIFLSAEHRYTLACLYCLVDYASVAWEEMDERQQMAFYDEEIPSSDELHLEYFWTKIINESDHTMYEFPHGIIDQSVTVHIPISLEGLIQPNTSFNQFAFKFLTRNFNKVATEYFFNQLTTEEFDSCISFTLRSLLHLNYHFNSPWVFPEEKFAEVLCYILSVMSPAQLEREVSAPGAYCVLTCLLYWPWQDLFLDIVDDLWNFLCKSDKSDLVYKIKKITKRGRCFPQFFNKFFPQSPRDFRELFVDFECSSRTYEGRLWEYKTYFYEFFKAEDTESIELVFRNLENEEKLILVSCYSFYRLFEDRVMEDRWHLVELCLREATQSKQERKRVEDTFDDFLTFNEPWDMDTLKQKWREFFQHLDESDAIALHNSSFKEETQNVKKTVVKKKRIN